MGVDYYNCNWCDEIYADCSDYGCCDVQGCGAKVCSNCCSDNMTKYCIVTDYGFSHIDICNEHIEKKIDSSDDDDDDDDKKTYKYKEKTIKISSSKTFKLSEFKKFKCFDCEVCKKCGVCCGCSGPNHNLISACTHGNINKLKISLKKGATAVCRGFLLACQYNHVAIVNELKNTYVSDLIPGIKVALKYKSLDILKNLINKDNVNSCMKMVFNRSGYENNYNPDSSFEIYKIFAGCNVDLLYFLVGACVVDDYVLVSQILTDKEFSADEYEEALAMACKKTNSKSVELLIDKADNYNECLLVACRTGDEKLVSKLILLGANNFNECMHMCYNKNIEKILKKSGSTRKYVNNM